MAENTLQAKRYSQAVFEIALEHKELEKWQSDLQEMVLLAQNEEFVSIMENPRFPAEQKSQLLGSQLNDINPLAMNLANILIGRGAFGSVVDIYSGYQGFLDQHRGIAKAKVITAVPLEEKEKQQLAERLSAISGKKIIMTVNVDPQIIGGMIAKVDGKIIDGSTRSQLAALKHELMSAGN